MSFIDSLTLHGLAVFPVTLTKKPNGKIAKLPQVRAWQELEAWENPSSLPSPAYGIALTSDWIIVDHDAYKDTAQNPIDQWLPELSSTFCVRTCSGGLHYWFKNPTQVPIRKVIKKEFPNVDFLSTGCYVVGAGSYFGEARYEVVRESLESAAVIPEDLLERIISSYSQNPSSFAAQEGAKIDSSVSNVPGYLAWLKNAYIAIQGQGGDHQTFAICAKGKDFGLDKEQTFECLTDWNSQCDPPWEEDELRAKIDNAYRYSQHKTSVDTPDASHFEAVETIQEPLEPVSVFALPQQRSTFLPDLTPGGALKPTPHNLRVFFAQDALRGEPETHCFQELFTYNLFANRIEYTRRPFFRNLAHDEYSHPDQDRILRDEDILSIRAFFAARNAVDFSSETVLNAVIFAANENPYHPIRDYIKALKWDGVPRLERLFLGKDRDNGALGDLDGYWGDFKAKNPEEENYRREVGRAFILAAVKRIFEPGCKWDNMLVLAGPQFTGKSAFVNIFGKPWNKILPTVQIDKSDFLKRVCESWWTEFPELSAIKKVDVDLIKSFLSTQKDTLRKPYGKVDMDYYRQGLCVMTVNPKPGEPFLRDETGHRRFWVINTPVRIECDAIEGDRDQLYAEAYILYRQGIRPSEDILERIPAADKEVQLEPYVDDFYDPLVDSIRVWIENNLASFTDGGFGFGRKVLTHQEIYESQGIMNGFDMTHAYKMRVNKAMRELGWNTGRTGAGRYFYKDFVLS